nr:unnamed protein product [Callosobruchus chinensis]
MASATRDFEEKIMQATYALRLANSKRFIAMEEKIARTWNDFISYLRTSGGGPVKDNFNKVETPPRAYESCSLENNSQDELSPSSAV